MTSLTPEMLLICLSCSLVRVRSIRQHHIRLNYLCACPCTCPWSRSAHRSCQTVRRWAWGPSPPDCEGSGRWRAWWRPAPSLGTAVTLTLFFFFFFFTSSGASQSFPLKSLRGGKRLQNYTQRVEPPQLICQGDKKHTSMITNKTQIMSSSEWHDAFWVSQLRGYKGGMRGGGG